MIIHIDDTHTLDDIKTAFHERYEWLKLDFYKQPHGTGEGSPANERIPGNPTIGEIRTNHTEGDLKFGDDTKVGELEQAFWKTFGISAQVLRKSGDQWLQTMATDDWTLAQQNEEGKEMNTRLPQDSGHYEVD